MVKLLISLLITITYAFGASSFDEALPPNMNEVVVVYNDLSTFDPNENGTYFNIEIINELKKIPGWRWQTRIYGISTGFTHNDINRPMATTTDRYCAYWDTTAAYSYTSDTDVDLPVGYDYINEGVTAAWLSSGGVDSSIKYVLIIGGDFPKQLRENQSGTYTVNSDPDPTISLIKTVDTYLELCVSPTAITNFPLAGIDPRDYWNNQFRDSTINDKTKIFKSGVYTQKRHTFGAGFTGGTVTQYVIVCRLDGFKEEHVISQIRKALKPQGFTPQGQARFWAVIDNYEDTDAGGGNSHYQLLGSASKTISSLYVDLVNSFGRSKMLFDVKDTLIIAVGDTMFANVNVAPSSLYFGYNGDSTLASSDSALFYWTAASYHSTDIPTDIAYQTELNIASNAVVGTSESWNGWAVNDTALRKSADDQTLAVQYLDNVNGLGFTYSICNGFGEVTASGTAAFSYLTNTYYRQKMIEAMYTPNCPFAVAGSLGFLYNQMSLKLGLPIGYWRKAVVPFYEELQYADGTHKRVKYLCNVPEGMDSLRLYMTSSIDTVDTTLNVTAFQSFSYILTTTGTFNRLLLSFVGVDAYRHPREIFISNTTDWKTYDNWKW